MGEFMQMAGGQSDLQSLASQLMGGMYSGGSGLGSNLEHSLFAGADMTQNNNNQPQMQQSRPANLGEGGVTQPNTWGDDPMNTMSPQEQQNYATLLNSYLSGAGPASIPKQGGQGGAQTAA